MSVNFFLSLLIKCWYKHLTLTLCLPATFPTGYLLNMQVSSFLPITLWLVSTLRGLGWGGKYTWRSCFNWILLLRSINDQEASIGRVTIIIFKILIKFTNSIVQLQTVHIVHTNIYVSKRCTYAYCWMFLCFSSTYGKLKRIATHK